MLAKEKKGAFRLIILQDEHGNAFRFRTPDLPIREEVVLGKSVEFFQDPEPCMIHRSAVLARIFAEFEQWMDSMGAGPECNVNIKEMPENLLHSLNLERLHANK